MLQIQCTKKLSEQLNSKTSKNQLIDNNTFYSWHAHLFLYKRKKYCLVMNNETRYNFIVGSLRKKEFNDFDSLVKEGIRANLLADGFDREVVEAYLKNCDEMNYGPTSDRAIISQVNQVIFETKHSVECNGWDGIEENINDLNRFNNATIMLKLTEGRPIEAMTSALAKEITL